MLNNENSSSTHSETSSFKYDLLQIKLNSVGKCSKETWNCSLVVVKDMYWGIVRERP